MINHIKNLSTWLVLLGLLSGCGGSPPVSYYTLSVETEAGFAESGVERSNLAVSVDHISLPEVVDRPQMVLQSGVNQVRLIDDHRWAESLKSEIPRVIAGNLSRLLMSKMVWSYPQVAKGPVDFRIFIDIRRFESTPGSEVAIDALWTIQPSAGEKGDPRVGRSTVQQPISGQGYEAIAAAHSRAIAEISREIAEEIRGAVVRRKASFDPVHE